MKGLGLKEMVARSRPDECPFCGEPRAEATTKHHLTCGDEVCTTAYQRYYARDRRTSPAERSAANARRRARYRELNADPKWYAAFRAKCNDYYRARRAKAADKSSVNEAETTSEVDNYLREH